jgi:hypothetical protein
MIVFTTSDPLPTSVTMETLVSPSAKKSSTLPTWRRRRRRRRRIYSRQEIEHVAHLEEEEYSYYIGTHLDSRKKRKASQVIEHIL